MKKYLFYLLIFWSHFSCQDTIPDEIKQEYANLPQELDYNIDVKPILSDKCYACHGPDKAKQKAGLRLDIAEVAYHELRDSPGKYAIDPGDLSNSELAKRILSKDPKEVMPSPSSHLTLNNYEKAVLIKWIQDGAEYKPHWAFEKPKKQNIPFVQNTNWVKNEIDNFILAKLETKKISPQNEADKETLLRRVYLDLTGLPPSLSEIDLFLADKNPNAYEKIVDKLLSSKNYGEKMAVDWMDVSRFADSHGYTVDRLRDMSPYRDWVIKAFNENIPYDKFINWQLAGDLQKNPTTDQLIATAFLRNHQQNMEGGIIEEEFRVEYVADRTNTLGTAFLGITLECTKCHDHKYDPITQKNYYQLFSFFNNINEAGQISWDDAMPVPTLQLPTKKQKQIVNFIQTQLLTIENDKNITTKIDAQFKQWIGSGQYKKDLQAKPDTFGLLGKFSFENNLTNSQNHKNLGKLGREVGKNDDLPNYIQGVKGKGLYTEGDVWFDSQEVGSFHRYQPFTISLWINIPQNLHDGVIFHRGVMGLLYNFRGYHLQIKNNKLDFTLARTAPENAITIYSKAEIPRNKWIQLAVTYDGSSKANGVKIYMEGKQVEPEIMVDNLTKDISFFERTYKKQPALQVGAWGRGPGLKNGKIDELAVYNKVLSPFEIGILSGKNSWQNIIAKPFSILNVDEVNGLNSFFVKNKSSEGMHWLKEIESKRKSKNDSIENIQEIMVYKEMNKPRQAYILNRGVYDAHGEKVFPNTPESILKLDKDFPKNRLGLANWVTHIDNPLTARVVINRYWQMLFGIGIVKTTNDFGNQGDLPSHKDLLDYLSVDFVENGWNVKRLLKKMVLSATYRQSSKASQTLRSSDPENRLLARGPLNRLSAEMMRDNALVASGLFKNEIGGKSIKPYQPEGLWAINGGNYIADSTDQIYKRSLYILVKRSVPHPSMATFDAPTRSSCTVRRQNTSTPLQALTLMNDPIYIETCKVMGQAITLEGNGSTAIAKIFRKLTGRFPLKQELDLLLLQQKSSLKKFKENPKKIDGWLNVGLYKIDNKLDKVWVAANTIVANTILNSDATITKR